MLPEMEASLAEQGDLSFELKPDLPTEEIRWLLRQSRYGITHTEGTLAGLQWVNRVQPLTPEWERKAMEVDAQKRKAIAMEAACVEALRQRGERVPRWRR
jgi:hypothetical protein